MDVLAFSAAESRAGTGPTLNPWDHARTAGGSSSGSAAALFYDGIDVAICGDQGGSIRAPASWCGVLGLKSPPTGSFPTLASPASTRPSTTAARWRARPPTSPHCSRRSPADTRATEQGLMPTTDYVVQSEQATDSFVGTRFGVVAEGFAEEIGVEPSQDGGSGAGDNRAAWVAWVPYRPSRSRCPSTCRRAASPSSASSRG